VPARAAVRNAVLGIGRGPRVSLAVATNILAALTNSSGGLTIGLDALGATDLQRAAEIGMSPDLLHRVAVIGSGTLDGLPHNGAVLTYSRCAAQITGKPTRTCSWSASSARSWRLSQ
jgi:H+/gluconate symporter-like permease